MRFISSRIDLDLPGNVKELFPQYLNVLKHYGKVINSLYVQEIIRVVGACGIEH
ncbi:MAG: hypothetical protein ACQES4_08190 [Bacillota bacterium]